MTSCPAAGLECLTFCGEARLVAFSPSSILDRPRHRVEVNGSIRKYSTESLYWLTTSLRHLAVILSILYDHVGKNHFSKNHFNKVVVLPDAKLR